MKNNITESFVSFDVAKILKENGFESNISSEMFTVDGFSFKKIDYNISGPIFLHSIERPSLSVAIDWIYLNFNVWISVEIGQNPRNFYPTIYSLLSDEEHNFKYFPKLWFENKIDALNSGIEVYFKHRNNIDLGFRFEL
jgi:hypothetical protein